MIPQVFRFICGSGRWRIAAASILAFVPFPLFAETPKYENPLGCGITSIAQFIKGALTIIIKIGVPLGAVFLIWAGFLFVTAQGNETKLATAKKTFVWSCIGLAVLLGSWVLAVAVEGTIKKLGGGPVGGDVAADGGCDVGDPEPEKGKFFWHSDVELTQVELAESEMELFTSADTSSVKAAPSELYDPNLLMLFEYVLYHEKYLDGYGDTPDEWLEELIDDNPDDDVDCKYEGGIIYIQNDDLAVKDEQTFLYAKFNTLGNPTRWYIGPVGDDGSAPNPDALIASLLSDSITTLFDFHTHPYGASATEGQKISSPSIADLDVAYQQKKTFKTKKIIPAVIAQNAVWEYAIVNGGTYQEALHSLQGEVDKFFANSPKASIYFDKRYKSWNPSCGTSGGRCSAKAWAKATIDAFFEAYKGKFGSSEEKNGKDLVKYLKDTDRFMEYVGVSVDLMYASGIFEIEKQKTRLIAAADKLGVKLTLEDKPHLFCKSTLD